MYEETQVTALEIGELLLDTLIREHFPERRAADEQRVALRHRRVRITTLQQALDALPEFRDQTGTLPQQLQQEKERCEAEIQRLTAEHHLIE